MSQPGGAPTAAVELRRIECAVGMPLGLEQAIPALDRPPADTPAPRVAAEAVVLAALQRPPCVVSFSGGRDSSAVLALATSVARREGLPMPVPVTLRFPGQPDSEESEWQAAVLEHIGLAGQELIDVTGDRFDVLGPDATWVLTTLGLAWPPNLHFHLPIVRFAAGGTVLTGFGGDEIAMSSRLARAERLLARRRVTGPRDLLTIGLRLAPPAVRFVPELVRARAELEGLPWLTARGRSVANARFAALRARYPIGWGRLLRRYLWRMRYFAVVRHNLDALAAHSDVLVRHPFIDATVLSAFAAHHPLEGVGGRPALLRTLVGELLPEPVLTRTSKASFDAALWTATADDYARSAPEALMSDSFVDGPALRASWLAPTKTIRSATLMQRAWLAQQAP